jgi:hypothetical protein
LDGNDISYKWDDAETRIKRTLAQRPAMSACPQIDNFNSSISVINDRWKTRAGTTGLAAPIKSELRA